MKAGSRALAAASSLSLAIVYHKPGNRSKIRRNSQNFALRQPGEHVAPRGVDGCGAAASDGSVQ